MTEPRPVPVPPPLEENSGLAFAGEAPWPAAGLTAAQVLSFQAARNPTGRPNSDVLRGFVGFQAGRPVEKWRVDFPLHYPEQEAALYVEPCRHLRSRLRDPAGSWWLNPHAQPALRTALARLERFLTAPAGTEPPKWGWVDSTLLPDESLLAIARDDDFTHGLLRSRIFQLWWRQHAARLAPALIVGAFPFPWAPATLLSSLTREQEERRLALARAARSADFDQLNSASAATYGWPSDLLDDELLAQLTALNRQRSPAGL